MPGLDPGHDLGKGCREWLLCRAGTLASDGNRLSNSGNTSLSLGDGVSTSAPGNAGGRRGRQGPPGSSKAGYAERILSVKENNLVGFVDFVRAGDAPPKELTYSTCGADGNHRRREFHGEP